MWYPRNLTAQQQEERRLAAVSLLNLGQLSQAQIARELGVHRQSVSRWARQLSQGGEQALARRTKTGRKPYLTTQQWKVVLDSLEKGALAAGFPTQRWTLSRIQRVIRQRFGVNYNTNYLSERLHRLGWSVQKPAVSARERSDELVEAWLKNDWPRIKKSLSEGSRDCVC